MSQSLQHYGILGMKWGVRRTPEELGHDPIRAGVSIHSDGSISISKGVNLQRLVKKGNESLRDMTYASVLEYDNAKYISFIGGKGLLGGGRDTILSIKATKELRAPSKKQACEMMVSLIRDDKDFRDNLTTVFGDKIGKKDLEAMIKNPSGKVANEWYDILNQSFTFDTDFDQGVAITKPKFVKAVLNSGYNMLRDENDTASGLAKAPIILLDPDNTVEITSISEITDDIRKASKETLKDYRRAGSDWMEKYLS